MGLLLQAVDVAGPLRWRWLLTDEDSGKPLADHQVDLDPGSDEVTAFGDLYEYARQHAAPDRREADAARIVADMGEWAGRVLLGEQVGAAIAGAAPVTVRVTAPDGALPVLAWPLELAHAGGGPLAARGDVTLVYDVGPPPGGPKPAGGGPLRILAVWTTSRSPSATRSMSGCSAGRSPPTWPWPGPWPRHPASQYRWPPPDCSASGRPG